MARGSDVSFRMVERSGGFSDARSPSSEDRRGLRIDVERVQRCERVFDLAPALGFLVTDHHGEGCPSLRQTTGLPPPPSRRPPEGWLAGRASHGLENATDGHGLSFPI